METPPTMHPAFARVVAFVARAEERGVEENHYARVQGDGSILVRAESGPQSYRVTFHTDPTTRLIRFTCSCPSGLHRSHMEVPCKHATRAARRLEREGLAVRGVGLWYDTLPREGADERDGDPFAEYDRWNPAGVA